MCYLPNIATCENQENVNIRQTDTRQSNRYVPLCFAGDTKKGCYNSMDEYLILCIMCSNKGHTYFENEEYLLKVCRQYEEYLLKVCRQYAPMRAWGVKSRMCPPYPQRDRKRRLNGVVCRNHRIKRVVPCRC